ncbi:MAG: single-stranded DNA-binding protein [Selenomonadaceae bacterium]|nr:single-stranded DNA-binding protein [Selenomonadaceae bacterium]
MNKVILIGRLTRDPEVRTTTTGKTVTSFTLAVDRRFVRRDNSEGQQTADFIPIVTWNKLAEICGNNLTKGRRISVEGRIQVRTYDDQNGNKRYVTEVVADDVEFLDSKNSAGGDGSFQQGGYSKPAPQQPAGGAGSFGPSIPDEEIPF